VAVFGCVARQVALPCPFAHLAVYVALQCASDIALHRTEASPAPASTAKSRKAWQDGRQQHGERRGSLQVVQYQILHRQRPAERQPP